MKNIEVIDLFCGIGGLTYGLIKQGLKVIAGIDNEESCKWAYEKNNKSKFLKKDIKTINGNDILKLYSNNVIKVLAGCPPCQPFSILRKRFKNQNEIDPKYGLIMDFLKIIINAKPDVLIMENVPEMESKEIFKNFINELKQLNYFITYKIVDCSKLGIPQTRKRLVLLASQFGKIDFIKTFQTKKITVKDAIQNLPRIKAGEICKQDKLHQSSKLSPLNLKRIKFLKAGKTWKDLPDALKPRCKINNFAKSFLSSYSRMEWDKPAPTITTNFLWYGTGKYGHPEQDRVISLREGAIFQTFPNDFDFFNPNLRKTQLKKIAKQIGNAVPIKLAEIIAKSVVKHLEENINISTLGKNYKLKEIKQGI